MSYGGNQKALKHLFRGHIYSTTPAKVGEWIDENPAYEVVVKDTSTHISNYSLILPIFTDIIEIEAYKTVNSKIYPITDYEISGNVITITNSDTVTTTTVIFRYSKAEEA